jgi:hypothetical protein
MSHGKHATISAWHREEDGSYHAELHGHRLAVRWRPESDAGHRGFLWSAVTPSGQKIEASHVEEEMEVAMGHAEEVAEGKADA